MAVPTAFPWDDLVGHRECVSQRISSIDYWHYLSFFKKPFQGPRPGGCPAGLAIDHLPFFIPRLIRMITIMTGPTMAMQKMTKMISSVVIVDIGCRQR
jgi:hypothetical protein